MLLCNCSNDNTSLGCGTAGLNRTNWRRCNQSVTVLTSCRHDALRVWLETPTYVHRMGLGQFSIIVLCLCGTAISFYAIHVKRAKQEDAAYTALCDIDETFSCSAVLTSQYAILLGYYVCCVSVPIVLVYTQLGSLLPAII